MQSEVAINPKHPNQQTTTIVVAAEYWRENGRDPEWEAGQPEQHAACNDYNALQISSEEYRMQGREVNKQGRTIVQT